MMRQTGERTFLRASTGLPDTDPSIACFVAAPQLVQMPSSQQSRSRRGTQSKPNSRTATSSSSAEPIIDADQDTDSESSEPEYEVEELRDHRRVGGKLQFFVKWKGYSEAEKTWEPEVSLQT